MLKILVHVHIYYIELWQEIAEKLLSINGVELDIYITTVKSNEPYKKQILSLVPDAKFIILENLGFDVGPFIHVINQVDLDNYDFVIKLHTKRDVVYGTYVNGISANYSKWRELLMSFLENQNNFAKIISLFTKYNKIGMIVDRQLISSSSSDYRKLQQMVRDYLPEYSHIPYKFVAGSMFIVRASILKKIQTMEINFSDFTESSRKDIYSKAHMWERIFGLLVYVQNYEIQSLIYKNSLHEMMFMIRKFISICFRFIFRVKVTEKGYLIIKFMKICLWKKKV